MCHQGRTSKTLWNRYWVMVTVAHFKTWNLKITRQHLNARKSTYIWNLYIEICAWKYWHNCFATIASSQLGRNNMKIRRVWNHQASLLLCVCRGTFNDLFNDLHMGIEIDIANSSPCVGCFGGICSSPQLREPGFEPQLSDAKWPCQTKRSQQWNRKFDIVPYQFLDSRTNHITNYKPIPNTYHNSRPFLFQYLDLWIG